MRNINDYPTPTWANWITWQAAAALMSEFLSDAETYLRNKVDAGKVESTIRNAELIVHAPSLYALINNENLLDGSL